VGVTVKGGGVVEVRDVGAGRYEVYSKDRHWEAFLSQLEATDFARALASHIASEEHRIVRVQTTWGAGFQFASDGCETDKRGV